MQTFQPQRNGVKRQHDGGSEVEYWRKRATFFEELYISENRARVEVANILKHISTSVTDVVPAQSQVARFEAEHGPPHGAATPNVSPGYQNMPQHGLPQFAPVPQQTFQQSFQPNFQPQPPPPVALAQPMPFSGTFLAPHVPFPDQGQQNLALPNVTANTFDNWAMFSQVRDSIPAGSKTSSVMNINVAAGHQIWKVDPENTTMSAGHHAIQKKLKGLAQCSVKFGKDHDQVLLPESEVFYVGEPTQRDILAWTVQKNGRKIAVKFIYRSHKQQGFAIKMRTEFRKPMQRWIEEVIGKELGKADYLQLFEFGHVKPTGQKGPANKSQDVIVRVSADPGLISITAIIALFVRQHLLTPFRADMDGERDMPASFRDCVAVVRQLESEIKSM